MPVFLGVQVSNGNLELSWDASYDIQGNALVYDLRLARQPTLGGSRSACTDADTPMPVLDSNVVLSRNGLQGLSLVPDRQLAAGRYYLQVIVRDSDGYCQSAFDRYYDAADNAFYFGVLAFDYDGEQVTIIP